MKALRHAITLLPLALGGLAACSSGGESGLNGDDRTGSVSTSIVGGHLDATTKGVVALGLAAHDQAEVTCSGSLLAPNLVLTARHCVSQIGDGTSPQVICGTSQFTGQYDPHFLFVSTDSQPSNSSELYPIKEVRAASDSSDVCGHDLALLILSGSGIPESEAKPIEPVLDHAPGAKQSFAAVGYGLQDPNDQNTAGTRMRFDTSSVFCVGSKCPLAYEAEDDEWVGLSPVCSGDSGGPALDANGRVFGVTSRGDKECTFALYSNVSSWASFVRNTAIAAAKSGNYTAPGWATDSGTSGTGGAGNVNVGGSSGRGGSSSHGGSSSGSGNASGSGSASRAGSSSGGNAASSAGTTSLPPAPVGAIVDPLGAACSGDCPGNYHCFTASSTPPGICVPECVPSQNDCPARYTCSEELKVCTPSQATVKTAHLTASCSVSPGPAAASGSSAFVVLLGLGLLGLCRRRR